ncbi:MAG: TonB-dependent receptor [Gammaproteobacteria bacterium]|nr:TonB-dependent receptor [Gammaproteobacteria bacterium]
MVCKKLFKPKVLFASLLVSGLVTSNALSAAELTEIVVTSQKRAQNLQEVPVSVTAFTGDTLEEMGVDSVGGVTNFAPNVSSSSGPAGGSDGFFFIRGVGQADNSVSVDPGVGTYVDEVYLGRVQGASFDLLDIERVEVLRGPQGTIFGRNTIGGAISVITADPKDEFTIGGKVKVGQASRRDVSLTSDIPFADTVGMKVSLHSLNQEGWAENKAPGSHYDDTYGDVDTLGGRAKLVWDATDDLTIKFAADASKGRGTQAPMILTNYDPANNALPGLSPVGVPLPPSAAMASQLSTDREEIFASTPAQLDTDASGVSATIAWEGPITIKSITSARQLEQTTWFDLDGSAYTIYDSFSYIDQDQQSQEFQFSGAALDDRLSWLAGLYFFKEDIKNTVDICVGGNIAFNDPSCLLSHNNIELETTSNAVFTHMEYEFIDQWTGILGVRYTKEEKEQLSASVLDNTDGVFTVFPPFIIPAPGTTIDLGSVPGKDSWSETTPKIGLRYELTEDLMFYGTYSEGFKSGGFSGRPSSLITALTTYDPETVQTIEAGVKSEFGPIRLNAAVFKSDYQNIQLLVINNTNGVFDTRNVGDADFTGVEVEAQAFLSEALQLMFGLGWLDNEYTSLRQPTAPQTLTVELSDKLPNTPEWTASLGAQYAIFFGDNKLAIRGDYNWRDEFYFQVENDAGELQEAYGVLNLRAAYSWAAETQTLALYGENVTDEEYNLNMQDSRGTFATNIVTPARPAEWGVEYAFAF